MIRYLNLPKLPDELTSKINYNYNEYAEKYKTKTGNYIWSDSFNEEINEWCKKNICEDMYWAFQIIKNDLLVHKDVGTEVKLSYLLKTGGDDAITYFTEEDGVTVTHRYVVEPFRWHLLKADVPHGVSGVNDIRFSITGRIFPT
jgi:hypothetical protein